jgi:hypothetical protein
MRSVGVLLLALTSCASGRQPGEAHRWTGPLATESPTPWNLDPATGLGVRLVAKGPFVLGRPMLVTVEAMNFGERAVCFDAQGVGHRPWEVRRADNSPAPFVGSTAGGVGTFQAIVDLEPGASCELTTVDLAYEFAILDPGELTAQFFGLWKWGGGEGWAHPGAEGSLLTGVPESARLRLRIEAGELRPRDRMLRRLLPIVPEGWILHDSREVGGEALDFRRREGAGKKSTAFTLICGEGNAGRLLGRSPFGPIRITDPVAGPPGDRDPTDDAVEASLRRDFLPGLEAAIRKALELR